MRRERRCNRYKKEYIGPFLLLACCMKENSLIALVVQSFPQLARPVHRFPPIEDLARSQQLILQVSVTYNLAEIAQLLADIHADGEGAVS